MNTTRRCSALFSQLGLSPRGAPTARTPLTPGKELAPSGTRHCHPCVVATGAVQGTGPQLAPSGTTNGAAAAGTVNLSIIQHTQYTLTCVTITAHSVAYVSWLKVTGSRVTLLHTSYCGLSTSRLCGPYEYWTPTHGTWAQCSLKPTRVDDDAT